MEKPIFIEKPRYPFPVVNQLADFAIGLTLMTVAAFGGFIFFTLVGMFIHAMLGFFK